MSAEIENAPPPTGIKPIIAVDKKRPQFFNFDQTLASLEKPVTKILPLRIHWLAGTVSFPASTSAITLSKLRITIPNMTQLAIGDQVSIDFVSIHAKLNESYFLQIPYDIIAIEEFSQVSHLMLKLADHADQQWSAWLQNWLKQLAPTSKYENNNEQLFKAVFHFYKRLYCNYLAYPILFSNSSGIQGAFLSQEASQCIDFSPSLGSGSRLSVEDFNAYISDQKLGTRIPLYVWTENTTIHFCTSANNPKLSPKQLIAWLQTKSNWRVLLIRTRAVKTPENSQVEAINKYSTEKILTNSTALQNTFKDLTAVSSILDISSLFNLIQLSPPALTLQSQTTSKTTNRVNFEAVSFKLRRTEARYDVSFDIQAKFDLANDFNSISGETLDISNHGLSIKLPYLDNPPDLNDSIFIDFRAWNDELAKEDSFFSKKPRLPPTEYNIVNISHTQNSTVLGLCRDHNEADVNFLTLLKEKLNDIKQSVAGVTRNEYDLYESLYASVWLSNNIAGLPFFLGSDEDGIRIIQAIANTQENHKLRKPYLQDDDWSFIQQVAAIFGLAIHELQNDVSKPLKMLSCGVYCYFEDFLSDSEPGGWKTKTDLEFKSASSKQAFIEEALKHPKHNFYHCSLISIKSYKDELLNQEINTFLSKAPHRFKEIHNLCNSLLAVGELNEVTKLIEFMYKN